MCVRKEEKTRYEHMKECKDIHMHTIKDLGTNSSEQIKSEQYHNRSLLRKRVPRETETEREREKVCVSVCVSVCECVCVYVCMSMFRRERSDGNVSLSTPQSWGSVMCINEAEAMEIRLQRQREVEKQKIMRQ